MNLPDMVKNSPAVLLLIVHLSVWIRSLVYIIRMRGGLKPTMCRGHFAINLIFEEIR